MTSKIFRSTVFVAVVVLLCSLGIVIGATVTLIAQGSDAEAAVCALEALLQRDVY